MHLSWRKTSVILAAAALATGGAAASAATAATTTATTTAAWHGGQPTATPVKHLVVIFQENVSFDHYFATYPHAANTSGNPFHAKPGTPSVNGLSGALLTQNPNEYNPQRLGPSQAMTCDQNHGYTAEQAAYDGGLMDKFVQATGNGNCPAPAYSSPGLVMDYYDGNTVTALWNYAQRFAMSDNSYDTTFGPSTPGALNVTSGQTYGAEGMNAAGQVVSDPQVVGSPNAAGVGTDYSDQDPYYDDCSNHSKTTLAMTGKNIGDLLSANGVSWGWFEGGFAPTSRTVGGTAACGASHVNVGGQTVSDYIPHHDPFQYYKSTANPHHLPPASLAEVGRGGQANHQYDLNWFFKSLDGGNLPSVSYLKAPGYADGHAGYSDPIDEQRFLVKTINAIEKSKYWRDTAIVINYDDSDGWYDHVMSPIINPSADPAHDVLNGTACGHGTPIGGQQDRCGFGQRLPMMVISPWAKSNYVDNTLSSQTSIVKFIEDNWLSGERIPGSYDSVAGTIENMFNFSHPDMRPLFLNPATGEPGSR